MELIHWFYFTLSCSLVVFLFQLSRFYRTFRRHQLTKIERPLFHTLPNGWVNVDKAVLLESCGDVTEVTTLEKNPPQVEAMLGYLTARYLHEVIRTAKSLEESDTHKVSDHALRGLTIGSALFNYSIPKSFVLMDRATVMLAKRFLANNHRRMTVLKWYEHSPEAVTAQQALLTGYEKSQPDKINHDTLLDFYHRTHPVIVHALLNQTKDDYFPSITCFIEDVTRVAKMRTRDRIVEHHMRCAVSIMVDILELEVPFDWLYISEAGLTVRDVLLGIEPKRAKLSLVK